MDGKPGNLRDERCRVANRQEHHLRSDWKKNQLEWTGSTMAPSSLDDLYRMTAYIYSEQNAIRPVAATFSHFVEVCGMLTIHDRRKKKEGVDFIDALCKALGWYFPLMAKLRVRSVEELIFRKYPYACPYCRKTPHEDKICKTVRGTEQTVDHAAIRRLYDRHASRKPRNLDEWQHMFQEIYPRSTEDRARSTLGLFEELGELAEAVRVFERYPKYFAGEAADTFSYLMGIANEYCLREAQENGASLSLNDEYLKRFPGLCIGCGHRVCVCPSIPAATVGRLSKELEIATSEELFEPSDNELLAQGRLSAAAVLRSIGGVGKLAERFPADRGDANSALMLLCMRLAAAVEKTNTALADRLHSVAIELGSKQSDPGSRRREDFLSSHDGLLAALRETWRSMQASGNARRADFRQNSLAFDLGMSLGRVRVLFVYPLPREAEGLRVSAELRVIKEAVELAGGSSHIEIDGLPAATIDDLRRALLRKDYEILHFSGHADSHDLVFENETGESTPVPLESLSALIRRYPTIRCVVLNACESLAELSEPIAEYTIGMEAEVTDEGAVEFARGFYDAFCQGKSVEFAVEEGKNAATLKRLEVPPTKLIKRA